MTDREFLLAAVLAPQPIRGSVIVLQGPGRETAERWAIGGRLHPDARLAHGTNTWEEAQHAAATAERSLTIVTSAYHQLRAFLTFLRALEIAGKARSVRLWNRSALSPLWGLAEEFEKIERYRSYGHVASYEVARRYIEWRNVA